MVFYNFFHTGETNAGAFINPSYYEDVETLQKSVP